MIEKSFAERLKELTLEKNLTQEQLSDLLPITKSSISKYEKNLQFPDVNTLHNLCDIFNVSTDYLLGKTNYKNIDEIVNELTDELANKLADQLITAFEKAGIPQEEIDLKLLDRVLEMYNVMKHWD